MKKRISLLCFCIILIVALAACSNSSNNKNAEEVTKTNDAVAPVTEDKPDAPAGPKTKLVFWTFDRHDAEFINKKVAEYNETNTDNIEVEVTSMAENYVQSVDIASASNQMPDILRPNQDTTIPFVKKGYLEPLDSFLTPEMKEKFSSVLQDQVNQFDGKIYTLPNFGYTLRLVYNKDLFEKAGIKSPPTTLDEMITAAKEITKVGKADGQYGFALNFKSPKSALDRSAREILQLSGYNGFGFEDTTGKFDFTHYKPVIEAFKTMKDEGSMLPGVESLDIDPLRAQFAQGKIGMYLSYSAEAGVYKNQFPTTINWEAVQAPTIDGNVKGAAGFANSGQWFGISSTSKNKEAAWKFLTYMYSDELLQTYHEEGLGLSAIPAIAAKAKAPEINGVEGFLVTKNDALWPIPPTVTVQGLNYGDAFLKYMLAGGSLDDTITDLNKRYNEALDKAVAAGEVVVTADSSFDPAKLQGSLLAK